MAHNLRRGQFMFRLFNNSKNNQAGNRHLQIRITQQFIQLCRFPISYIQMTHF